MAWAAFAERRVTVTVTDLLRATGAPDSADNRAELDRHLSTAIALVDRYVPPDGRDPVPAAVREEAIYRVTGWLYDAPAAPQGWNQQGVMFASGARHLLSDWREHRAVRMDRVVAALEAAGIDIDQVEAVVRRLIAPWALATSSDHIPQARLGNAPAGAGGGLSQAQVLALFERWPRLGGPPIPPTKWTAANITAVHDGALMAIRVTQSGTVSFEPHGFSWNRWRGEGSNERGQLATVAEAQQLAAAAVAALPPPAAPPSAAAVAATVRAELFPEARPATPPWGASVTFDRSERRWYDVAGQDKRVGTSTTAVDITLGRSQDGLNEGYLLDQLVAGNAGFGAINASCVGALYWTSDFYGSVYRCGVFPG